MNEIDLFPDDLRKRLLFFRWFKLTGFALVVLTLLFVAAFVLLREANAQMEEQIDYFQTQREITNANRQQLEQLNQQKKNLTQQLDLLSGLRSGASAEQMFQMIDRWLTDWRFRRAGTPVEENRRTVNTGYFIVIPAGSERRKEETWKIETHMNIRGQALDHVAMSMFVLNLTQQPEIEKVRIVGSSQTEVNQTKVVEFSLDIVVSARREQG